MAGASPDAGSLVTLEELASRTDVPEATLLGWGADHGFPRPELFDGPAGLYPQALVPLLRQVVTERAAGAPLGDALARARAAGEGAGRSVFEAVVAACPELVRHVLDKTSLLAVSRVLEDETHGRHGDVLLVGGFQRERYYRQSAARWQRLAQRCAGAVAFADLPHTDRHGAVLEVAGSWDDPFIREWFLVCHGRGVQSVLAARERPPRPGVVDGARVFESVWTTDPAAVRAGLLASRTRLPPDCDDVRGLLTERIAAPVPASSPARVEQVMHRAFAAHTHLTAGTTDRRRAAAQEDPDTHRTLAARLHDETLQLLLALRQDLEELRVEDPGRLRDAQASLARAIAELRDIVAGAPPPRHERGPLAQELAAVAAQVRRRTGIATELHVAGDVPGEHHELLVALTRELATNSGLHAHASAVTITVDRDATTVTLTVRDDGFGFSEQRRARAAATGHLGLPLARQRVERAGGTLRIDGQAVGGGTRIEATLPVPARPPD